MKGTMTEIDETTGFPVVPEDYFFRVAEVARLELDEDTLECVKTLRGEVLLVKLIEVEKARDLPIRGTHWWDRWRVVRMGYETYTVLEEKVVQKSSFDRHYAWEHEGEVVPAFAENVVEQSGRSRFDVPFSKEGIVWIAAKLWKEQQAALEVEREIREAKLAREQEARRKIEEFRAIKDELLGDYPPKTL